MYKSHGKSTWQPQPQPSYSGSSVGSADYGEVKVGGSEGNSYQKESGPEVMYDNNPAPVDPTSHRLPINQIDEDTLNTEVKEAFKLMELLGKAQKKEDLSFMEAMEDFTFQMYQGDPDED